MGSLFYINVPTRTYEVFLRQKEKQIVVLQETDDIAKKNLPTNMASGLIGVAQARKRSSIKASEISAAVEGDIIDGGTILSEASGAGAAARGRASTVDLYEATVDNKPATVIISNDSMAIIPEEDKRRKSIDSETDKKNNIYLEKHLEQCLSRFVIYDATWSTSIDGNFSQISFTVAASRAEAIINNMTEVGIGTKYESTLSVCSAIVYYNRHQEELHKKDKDREAGKEGKDSGKKDTFRSKFIASIKSRLTVAQVVQNVQNNAVITFDYIVLICVAAIIAALGLLESSSVNLVASMLISPLMGPIIAGCFGAVIKDKKLMKTGLISELVGISICFVVGFIFGLPINIDEHSLKEDNDTFTLWGKIPRWPTAEMVSRSQPRGIVVGAMVAIPSGAGVALSILAGNAGSLVGVAISASLLPPAVNAGMEWGIAFRHALHSPNPFASCNGTIDVEQRKHDAGHLRNHVAIYCPNNMVKEFALMGICSFSLTVVNIILILLAGALVLKIKEVAPHTTRKTMNRFWKEDIKIMRDYNKVHGTFNKREIFHELNKLDNGAEIRDELKNDATFTQVTQRNMYVGSNILDTTAQDAESIKKEKDVEGGGESGSSGAGFFGKIGGLFSSKKADTEVPDAEVESDAKSKANLKPSQRPHLAKSPTSKTVGRR